MATDVRWSFFPVGEFTMLTFSEAQKQFIGLFDQTARYNHRYKGVYAGTAYKDIP
jgi:hypothetical protein